MSSQETCSSLHLTSVGQKSRGNLLRLLLLYCCCIYFCVCSCSVPDFCEGLEPQTNLHSIFDVKPIKHSKKRVFCCITEDRLFMAVDAYQTLVLDSIPMDEVCSNADCRSKPGGLFGNQFTCFTRRKVQILTQKALQRTKDTASFTDHRDGAGRGQCGADV